MHSFKLLNVTTMEVKYKVVATLLSNAQYGFKVTICALHSLETVFGCIVSV